MGRWNDDDEDYDDEEDDDEEEGDSDDEEDEEDEEDDDEQEDPEETLQGIEDAFRQDRARIRTSQDIHELQAMRAQFRDVASRTPREAARIRAHDLVDLVDARITDIKARRMSERRR